MSGERIHVAMIIQAYLPRVGGAERQLAALAPLLRQQGVDVTIITRRYPGLRRHEEIDGVPVYRLPIPGPKAVASLSFTATALPLLRRLDPDLIHAHELLSPTTTAVAAGQWLRVPVLAKVLRGGVLGDVAKLNERFLGPWRLRLFRRLVDGFIVISEEIDRELAAQGVGPQKRLFVPNGVDTARFSPASPGEKRALRRRLNLEHGKVGLFTGRLVAEKQIDRVISLWPRVREAYPDAQLVILGQGPEENRLRRMAGPGVRLPGRVEDVVPYLRAADLFILPSATEGLSNAMLEAMSAGLPVLATRVGGAPDLIEHGESGWLVPPDDPGGDRWLAGISALLGEQSEPSRVGERARCRVVAEYGLAATADELVRLYRHLCSSASYSTLSRPYV